MERQRRAALRSSVIQELRQQYSDAPEEIREKRDFQSERQSHEELHRYPSVCFIQSWHITTTVFTSLSPLIIIEKLVRCVALKGKLQFFGSFLNTLSCTGKIMKNPWWCASPCQRVIGIPRREAWWECPASWAGSHTLETSRLWLAVKADRCGLHTPPSQLIPKLTILFCLFLRMGTALDQRKRRSSWRRKLKEKVKV